MKLLFDFFPLIAFFTTFKLYGIYPATAVIIVVTLLQFSYQWFRHKKVEKIHLFTLVIVLVMGGLTLIFQDDTFIKWKPTVVNWLFTVILLGAPLMGRNLVKDFLSGQTSKPAPDSLWTKLNIAAALFFLALGSLNLYVAFNFSQEFWVNFKVFGILGLTLVFVVAMSMTLIPYIDDKAKNSK
ncbi:septation protein A [Pelagibaculum spongiae]|uniref:Inner membrane-spanning protein YciB n=1 Tax=Pelagibaculum spongiae TaxID=2080658 RepID=A0A2V1H354_9GAMM|nr:septation protein A [Pelagibaculum spongiae]PVZ71648.1 septation protein A [Pelagibaculum spongiae]